MSYKTLEVELENGRVTPHENEILPAKAHALLTLLPADGPTPTPHPAAGSGLNRFLSAPTFSLSRKQFESSVSADFFEQ